MVSKINTLPHVHIVYLLLFHFGQGIVSLSSPCVQPKYSRNKHKIKKQANKISLKRLKSRHKISSKSKVFVRARDQRRLCNQSFSSIAIFVFRSTPLSSYFPVFALKRLTKYEKMQIFSGRTPAIVRLA